MPSVPRAQSASTSTLQGTLPRRRPGGWDSRTGDGLPGLAGQRAGTAMPTARGARPGQGRTGHRRGCTSDGLRRKRGGKGAVGLLPALQPHNGIILQGHKMPFVAHQPNGCAHGVGTRATAHSFSPACPWPSHGGSSVPTPGLPARATGAGAAHTHLPPTADAGAQSLRRLPKDLEALLPTTALAPAVGTSEAGQGGLVLLQDPKRRASDLTPGLTTLTAQQQPCLGPSASDPGPRPP